MTWIASDPPSPLPPYWSAIDQLPGDINETIILEKQKAETKDILEKRKVMGWDNVHTAMNNLPRCRVHGTVHSFFLFYSFYFSFIHKGHFSFFSSCSPGDCVSLTSEPQTTRTNYTPMPYNFDRVVGPTYGLSFISSKSFFFFFQPLPTPQGECWFPWKTPIHYHVRIHSNGTLAWRRPITPHKISSECNGTPYELVMKNNK